MFDELLPHGTIGMVVGDTIPPTQWVGTRLLPLHGTIGKVVGDTIPPTQWVGTTVITATP